MFQFKPRIIRSLLHFANKKLDLGLNVFLTVLKESLVSSHTIQKKCFSWQKAKGNETLQKLIFTTFPYPHSPDEDSKISITESPSLYSSTMLLAIRFSNNQKLIYPELKCT